MRWIIALLLLSSVALAQSQQTPAPSQPAANKQQRPQDDQKNTQKTENIAAERPGAFDFFTTGGLKKISTYCAAQPYAEPDKWLHEKFICDVHLTDIVVAVFTALLVLVTIPLTGIGIWQAVLARSTARRQLRAYLSFAGTIVENYGTKKALTLNYTITNHGQTPAFRVNYVFGIDVIAANAISEFETPAPERDLKAETTVFPDIPVLGWFHHSVVLSQVQFTEVENNKAVIYCWGTVTYRDAFKKRRETKFSLYVGGPNFIATQKNIRAGQKAPGPGYLWQFGQNHNKAT